MNRLLNALQTKNTVTENGMPTHSSSGNYVLDMFFKMGGSRGMDQSGIEGMFSRAFSEDANLAVKALFYNRDVRQGQGERRSFQIMFKYLCHYHPELATRLLYFIPEYGRWDDVLVAIDTPVEKAALELISLALQRGDALCAKWMPRENKKNKRMAIHIMSFLGMTPRKYRRTLSSLTKVVETSMCSGEWSGINYNHVPSKASHKYRKAFARHDYERYDKWIKSLADPKSGNKIHAGAIFPHDVVTPYLSGTYSIDSTIEAQWKALPDFVKNGESFIPVCDVSGSMTIGDKLPIRVSIALGIYLAERNKGAFKNHFITFSGSPTLISLPGNSLLSNVQTVARAEWGMNTNLEAVFNMLLVRAIQFRVPESEMPRNILIISDMQFDQCAQFPGATALEMIRVKYAQAGYTLPNVIFWNVRTSEGVPVKINNYGVALVSGFSPSIMTQLLGGEMSPMGIMLKTLLSDRYKDITAY